MVLVSLFVAIAGNIGSGKTSLASMLGQHLGCDIYYESVENNPYLDDFYLDMHRWSFNIQIYFLSERFRAHQDIIKSDKSCVQDRTIYEDKEIFARALYEQGSLSQRDYNNYIALNDHMSSFLKAPDLLLYLRKSVPVLLDNIAKRNRGCENNIPIEYLTRLNNYYEDWISRYKLGNLVVIDSDHLDFVQKRKDFEFIVDQMENSLPQPNLFQTSHEINKGEIILEHHLNPAPPRLY